MQPSISRPRSSEHSPTRKNKTQSQRVYRSKETDGFTELRDALLLVDPFDTPLGRDATRHQLLITAAKKLRHLADENQKLILQLSATHTADLREPETGISPEMNTQNVPLSAWPTQGDDMERLLLSMAAELAPQVGDYGNTIPTWSQSLYGHAREPCNLRSGIALSGPLIANTRQFY